MSSEIWDEIKNLPDLKPYVYGMKKEYENKIKVLESDLENVLNANRLWKHNSDRLKKQNEEYKNQLQETYDIIDNFTKGKALFLPLRIDLKKILKSNK